MANRWFTYISELAEQTQKEVTNSPQNWRRFLTTASRFYKSYDFDDQLLITPSAPMRQPVRKSTSGTTKCTAGSMPVPPLSA